MKNFARLRLILMVVCVALLVMLLTSGCNVLGIGGQPAVVGPTTPAILAPEPAPGETIVKMLVRSPVQIQSAHTGAASSVELWVQAPGQNTPKLIRSDVPINGYVTQEWVPQQPGDYVITLKTLHPDDQPPTEMNQTIRVLDNVGVNLASVAAVAAATTQPQPTSSPAVEFAPPTVTVQAQAAQAAPEAQIAVVREEVQATATTEVLHYPPPPPAPGVPPGPTQAQLPDFGPPVCDAAKYVGVYSADTSLRVMVTEDDDVPALAVGGTLVHRAWRVQNIGTCTWGPGYEVAFYGGRAMGSGGVAFEAIFPSEPGRRNVLVDTNRLIVPKGFPNQVAVVEVVLETPVTPGIHQSYWRMRNPQGVFFGPIFGVTFETVRDCKPGIYGAPVINKFDILGVGNVYRPTNPVNVQATYGDSFTLEWNIINATNFDIVMEDPTGNIQSTSTPDQSGRATFTPKTLGRHTITLYADNGSCTVTAQVFVDVVPPAGDQFQLNLILSGAASTASTSSHIAYSTAVAPGNVHIEWHHYDPNTDQFILQAESYRRSYYEYCPLFDSIFGWKGYCYMTWSDWQQVDKVDLNVGGQGDAQGAATITNLESRLCPSSYDPTKEEYEVRYVMLANENGRPANPPQSNTVSEQCPPSGSLPTEIQGPGSTPTP